jgi:hypothetical protein
MTPKLHHSIAALLGALCLLGGMLNDATAQSVQDRVRQLDTDGDGKVSKAEAGGAPWFAKVDRNGDGLLDAAELAVLGQRGTTPNPPAPPSPPQSAPATPASLPAAPPSAPASAADLAFFEKSIRPVLVKSCHNCHSAAADEVKAGLSLDARESLLRGGDSGPAVVPGKPEESLLITSLRHSDPDLKMPPDKQGGKLDDSVIADFVEWVRRGVPMPEGRALPVNEKLEARMDHWAFKPVKDSPAPAVKNASWPRTEVDRFVLAELEKKGLAPVADAEPAALLRRVHLDLTGLPPSAEQVSAFLAAPSESRIQAVIDELMKSPQFGERWGRHWLDVARYAESSGKETDIAYPHAWRYRDYVIQAFNNDKPFDQFIQEQIAGDLLPARNDQERAERLVATGFLAIGPKGHGEKNPLKFEMDLVDEQIDTVTQAFLGMTMACARCHDHKYDPVSQRDYYALAGIFRSTDTRFGTSLMAMNGNAKAAAPLPDGAKVPDALAPLTAEQRRRIEQTIADYGSQMSAMAAKGQTSSGQYVITMLKRQTETARLALFEADGSPKKLAVCAFEGPQARDSELFLRGEVDRPGTVVPRGLPTLAKSSATIPSGSGRKELAQWIASPQNPLTARVMVNRVWLHLFGQGLVATPDNFGLSGHAPSNPALLDHLAVRFVQSGWSVKQLIRHLMTSRVYALGTARDPRGYEIDPDNTLLWRMTPRRLDAECIRDAILFTSGSLDLKPPTGSPIGAYGDGHVIGAQMQIGGPPDQLSPHRSVYLPVIRNAPLESLALFDMASGTVVTGHRAQTTVPAQSLYLLNSDHLHKLSDLAAQRLLSESPGGDEPRVKLAYHRFFNRPPTASETQAALAFVNSHSTPLEGWSALCRSLWASHDFLARR